VAEQLGHADVQMVFQIYGKFIPEDYKRQRARPGLRVVADRADA
jgi:integrase